MAPSDASSQDHAESSSQVSNGPDAELEQDENLPFGPIQSDSEQETSESEDSQPTVSNIGSKGKRKAVNFEDDEEEDAQPDDAKETQNMVQSLRKAASADVEKGQHVRRQLVSSFYAPFLLW